MQRQMMQTINSNGIEHLIFDLFVFFSFSFSRFLWDSQQMPTNQQQFQAQSTMPTQQMQMQSQQQPQVSYPHGQTLPANALQGIVSTGAHMAGLPITSQIPPSMVNVSHQQAMSMGHLPNNIELNMNMPTGMNPMAVNHSGFMPQQVQTIKTIKTIFYTFSMSIVSVLFLKTKTSF